MYLYPFKLGRFMLASKMDQCFWIAHLPRNNEPLPVLILDLEGDVGFKVWDSQVTRDSSGYFIYTLWLSFSISIKKDRFYFMLVSAFGRAICA